MENKKKKSSILRLPVSVPDIKCFLFSRPIWIIAFASFMNLYLCFSIVHECANCSPIKSFDSFIHLYIYNRFKCKIKRIQTALLLLTRSLLISIGTLIYKSKERKTKNIKPTAACCISYEFFFHVHAHNLTLDRKASDI